MNAKDKYGRVINAQYLIIAESGHGKGLADAGIVQALHKEGYIVIVLADPKDEMEFAFAMFEPEETYHLDNLKRTGIKPEAVPIKLYHPFTFRFPKKQVPEMKLFTLPIKNLTGDEYSFLAETDYQTELKAEEEKFRERAKRKEMGI